MVKRVEYFKKCVSIIAIVLMGGVMIATIVIYCMLIMDLQADKYFLARTRQEIIEEIDFEQIAVFEIRYFLYKNATEGA